MKITANINRGFSILLIVNMAFIASCNKGILDTEPKTVVPEDIAYGTPGKILAQVYNLYGQLQNATFYGGRFIVFNEQRADEFGQNDGNAAAGSAIWNQNVGSTSEYINNLWAAGYSAINASNILIDKLTGSSVIPDSLAKLYIAECKFVRALSYFSLVQTYAKPYFLDRDAPGVPLRLTAITTAGNNDLPRSSVARIYEQIISDLDEAEADLPGSYATGLMNVSRAKKITAIALKTRVYLHQGNHEKVIDEAEKVVSESAPFQHTTGNTAYHLEPNIGAVFSGSYTGNEAIFSIPFANTTNETPAAQSALAFNYLTQPIIFLAPGGVVSDPVFSNSSDSRSSLVGVNASNQKVLRKFAITTAPFRDYVPVIRYAEVLLNYAEAAAYSNDLTMAAELLNAVRKRSDGDYSFPSSEIDTREALINAIFTERRIEFVGEGLRLGDLQRKGMAIPAKVGAIGTAPTVLPGASNYIWPIPSGEISTNKLIVPNP